MADLVASTERLVASFPTTQWVWVSEAGDPESPGAGIALADLCRTYWYPIYSFIRSRGHSPDESADLTQEYFRHLLEGRLLASADRDKGRFRSLLRADCDFFLADHRDYQKARKRGGDRERVSLDMDDLERRYHLEPAHEITPERLFDRTWAIQLLAEALSILEREETQAGRGAQFERLRPMLTEGRADVSYAALADTLGMTPTAVQSAAQRLRQRYREALRAEVAATLGDHNPELVAEEIRSLFVILGR